ncbi:hypothetical protein TNCV_138941 [Trichonephila clavipes]|nr:hypothetical protein TNCV_138941 [Trichonephila clavipes]
MFAVCGVPYGEKWCSGNTSAFPCARASLLRRRMKAWGYLCVPFGPHFTVDGWHELARSFQSAGGTSLWCPLRDTAVGLVLQIRGVGFTRWILALML